MGALYCVCLVFAFLVCAEALHPTRPLPPQNTQACSETAKSLANVVDTSQSTGLAAVWSALRRLLPIPGLK